MSSLCCFFECYARKKANHESVVAHDQREGAYLYIERSVEMDEGRGTEAVSQDREGRDSVRVSQCCR
jgi:hypothetical protein